MKRTIHKHPAPKGIMTKMLDCHYTKRDRKEERRPTTLKMLC